MEKTRRPVVVTGFGPFGEYSVNASWIAVQLNTYPSRGLSDLEALKGTRRASGKPWLKLQQSQRGVVRKVLDSAVGFSTNGSAKLFCFGLNTEVKGKSGLTAVLEYVECCLLSDEMSCNWRHQQLNLGAFTLKGPALILRPSGISCLPLNQDAGPSHPVFLKLCNIKMAGEFWELKSTHLTVAEFEKL